MTAVTDEGPWVHQGTTWRSLRTGDTLPAAASGTATLATATKPTGDIATMRPERYEVRVDGTPTWVHYTPRGDTATVSSDAAGPVTVEIEATNGHDTITAADVTLSQPGTWPRSQPMGQTISGGILSFLLPAGFHGNLFVVLNGKYVETAPRTFDAYPYQLSMGVLPLETDVPAPGDVTHYFGPGVHTGSTIVLSDGQSVYIHKDALVRRRIVSPDTPGGRLTNGLHIYGRGILEQHTVYDDTTFGSGAFQYSSVDGLHIEGITLVGSAHFTLIPFNCDGVLVDWVRIMGCEVHNPSNKGTPDGFDPIGSSNVTFRNSLLNACDDGSAPKMDRYHGYGSMDNLNYEDVLVVQGGNGNGTDIGYELGNDSLTLSNISYRRMVYALTWHVSDVNNWRTSALGIHILTKANVTGVLYEDVDVVRIHNKNHYLWAGTFYSSSLASLGALDGAANRGVLSNVTYRRVKFPTANVTLLPDGQGGGAFYIKNKSGGPAVSGVTFDQCTHGGTLMDQAWATAQGSNWDVATSDGVTFL